MLQRRSSSSCCAVHGASIGLSWAGNGPLYDSWTLTGVHIRLFLVTRRANDHGGFYFRTVEQLKYHTRAAPAGPGLSVSLKITDC